MCFVQFSFMFGWFKFLMDNGWIMVLWSLTILSLQGPQSGPSVTPTSKKMGNSVESVKKAEVSNGKASRSTTPSSSMRNGFLLKVGCTRAALPGVCQRTDPKLSQAKCCATAGGLQLTFTVSLQLCWIMSILVPKQNPYRYWLLSLCCCKWWYKHTGISEVSQFK